MSILLWVLLLPLMGATILLFFPSWKTQWIRVVALTVSLVNFCLSLLIWLQFDNSTAKFQFMSTNPLVKGVTAHGNQTHSSLANSASFLGSSQEIPPMHLLTSNELFGMEQEYSGLGFILGVDGNLWFTELNSNIIGIITPTGKVTELHLSILHAQLGAITLGADNNIWFSDSGTRDIGYCTRIS